MKQLQDYELEQVKKRDEKSLDKTYVKALQQVNNVRKSLTFDDDKSKEEGGLRKHKRHKQATTRKVVSSETDTDGKL